MSSNKEGKFQNPNIFLNRHRLICSGLGGALGILLSLFYWAGFFSTAQLRLSDKLFLTRPVSPKVVIVAIDDRSIHDIGRWPWDRRTHAMLLDQLGKAKPAVVGFDVAFPEPSSSDDYLAKSIGNLGKLVLPSEMTIGAANHGYLESSRVLAPVEKFARLSAVGFSNTPIDPDGVLRRIPAFVKDADGKVHGAFFLEILKKYFGNEDFLKLMPFDGEHRILVNFSGPPSTFPSVSYVDALNGKVDPSLFKDKIVIIGATAPDLHDEQVVPTSNGRLMPGAEIHASAINTVLTGNFLKDESTLAVAALLILTGLAGGFLFCVLRAVKALFAMLGAMAVYLAGVFIAFDRGLVLNISYQFTAIALTYLLVLLYKYLVEGRERRKLRKTFSQYVSRQVVEEILKAGDLKLGGDKRNMTVMFSDIRGFTSISEKMGPEALVSLLNEYLSAMTDIILGDEGLVDKYIGDAIMAFWGAPIQEPDHAFLALKSALGMRERLKQLQAEWSGRNLPPLAIGVGVNSGEMVAGNMGSNQRFNYTVIGDNVNLASRLEGINKVYGTTIIFSDQTLEELKKTGKEKELTYRLLDKVTVKGKKVPVKIYELLGFSADGLPPHISVYEQAVTALYENKIDEAEKLYNDVLKLKPDDKTSQLHLERIKLIKEGKLQWAGVHELTSK